MKQKKTIKQVLCMLLIICCTVTSFNVSMVQTQAATDITDSATHNIRALCEFFPSTCGSDLVDNGSDTMKIGQKKKYDFSNASTRRRTILCDWKAFTHGSDIGITPNMWSKRVFGKSTSKINTQGGDWGESWPEIKVKKIYKLSSGKYKVKANVNWNELGDYGKMTVHKIGDLTINIKKKSKSYYGYVVKSMTLKKVADI